MLSQNTHLGLTCIIVISGTTRTVLDVLTVFVQFVITSHKTFNCIPAVAIFCFHTKKVIFCHIAILTVLHCLKTIGYVH